MKYILNNVLAGCALASLAFSNPIIPKNVAVGAREATITNGMIYVGPITPGGKNFTLTGSAEEIHKQIKVLNPAFDANEFEVVRKFKASWLARRTINYGCCGPNPSCTPAPFDSYAIYNPASTNDIDNKMTGVNYLYHLPGDCGTGPGGVARLSCSWNDAIFFVNTVPANKLASCQYIAQVAQNIIAGCGAIHENTLFETYDVNGKECDNQGYCIIVAGSNC